MRVLQVSAELAPLLKTGGLADVAGALPAALAGVGCDVRLLLPGLPALRAGLRDLQPLCECLAPWGEAFQVLRGHWPGGVGHTAYLIDAPALHDRAGDPYASGAGQAYADNHRRFGLLGWVAAQLGTGLDADWQPQIVHAHDWHAGLAAAYLRLAATASHAAPARSVFTVHNLAYQGLFPASAVAELGLPAHSFQMQGLEFHGQLSFMKAGLHYADRITTVSPTYAREVLTPEQGCGLDGLLRERRAAFSGILNGVDPRNWSPAADALIAQRYDATQLPLKAVNKAALQAAMGLAQQPGALLFGVVSRLTEQKGLHLVLRALPELIARGGQLAVLGTGDAALIDGFAAAARAHPESVTLYVGYDEARSHAVFAGCDVTLVPSRFEPCGLTQLYGLAYGSLPLVHRVGGLADTVVDCSLENLADDSATGFVFNDFTPAAYSAALRRAFALQAKPGVWAGVQRAAMRQVFDWNVAAEQYLGVYRAALSESA